MWRCIPTKQIRQKYVWREIVKLLLTNAILIVSKWTINVETKDQYCVGTSFFFLFFSLFFILRKALFFPGCYHTNDYHIILLSMEQTKERKKKNTMEVSSCGEVKKKVKENRKRKQLSHYQSVEMHTNAFEFIDFIDLAPVCNCCCSFKWICFTTSNILFFI